MRSGPIRHPKLDSRLKAVLFLLAGALALLTIGLGTAFAEGEEEGPAPIDPVVVPEVEVPTVSNPPTAPAETPTTSAPSSPAPVTRTESGSSGSSGGRTSSPSTGTHGSSGGSKPAPTQTNHGLADSGGSGGNGGGGSTGGSGGGGNSTSVPAGSGSPTSTTSLEQSTSSVEKAAAALAAHAGQATGKGKKAQQDAVSHLGEALLGAQVSVSKPKPHHDAVPAFVPLPGKNKSLYFLLILVILAIASFVVWTQFRGPRQSRRRKAHIDHRTTTAARLTPAERVRARQWTTEHGHKDARPPGRKARPPRRKAA